MTNHSIGIDLGGSSVKGVRLRAKGELLRSLNFSFNPNMEKDWERKVREMISDLEEGGRAPATHLGISAPGLAAADGRSISWMPGRLAGLEKLDWTEHLGRSRMVPVLNDAQAALLGEVKAGAARGSTNVILLTLGTGVGGAAMVDGRILRGQIGRAGHLGHISLDPMGAPDITGIPGSLEDAIGNCTIEKRTAGRFKTTHDLVAAVQAGDGAARELWLTSVRALAAAVASFINVLDCEVVVIGGGIAAAGPTLFEPLEEFLEKMEWRPGGHKARIVRAILGEFAGAHGAAFNALSLADK